jgi:hypothetical protein
MPLRCFCRTAYLFILGLVSKRSWDRGEVGVLELSSRRSWKREGKRDIMFMSRIPGDQSAGGIMSSQSVSPSVTLVLSMVSGDNCAVGEVLIAP